MGYKGNRKECRYEDTSGKKLDAANPQTTGELPYFLTWEVLRDAKAPRWPRRGVFASRASYGDIHRIALRGRGCLEAHSRVRRERERHAPDERARRRLDRRSAAALGGGDGL